MTTQEIELKCNEILNYFTTLDNLQIYWKEHARRDVEIFTKATFNLSYYKFKIIVLNYLGIADRTKDDCKIISTQRRNETNLKRYGRTDVGQFNSYEHKQSMIAKYGVDNYFKTDQIKQLTSNRCRGISLSTDVKNKISNTVKSTACQEQTKKTNLQKYGVKYTFQSDNNKTKAKQTYIDKYGMLHSPKQRYYYDNQYFDSLPELALYLYAIAHNEPIIREPCSFEYSVENNVYNYFPDFLYNGTLVEIKGNQFLAKDGRWILPYDHKKDNLMEAKHQCALKNNVKIFYADEYKKYLEWFNQNNYKKEDYLVKK